MSKLTAKGKDLANQNIENKKKLVKKHGDMVCVAEGRPIESDDPFNQFLRQLTKEKEKKKR